MSGWFIPPSQNSGPICSIQFKVLTKSATKAGPLPDPMLVGNPNLGTISLSRHQATSDALSVQVGHISRTHMPWPAGNSSVGEFSFQ